MYINDNCNINKSNYSILGNSYEHPKEYSPYSSQASYFLNGGARQFQVKEIEVILEGLTNECL